MSTNDTPRVYSKCGSISFERKKTETEIPGHWEIRVYYARRLEKKSLFSLT